MSDIRRSSTGSESSPLLGSHHDARKKLELSEEDGSNPRSWTKVKKYANIAVIGSMALLSPLASSMFAPGIDKIADSLKVEKNSVIGCQTGFVVMLGIGPLVLAPLSETFGRRPVYLICFTIFTLLQIPTALAQTLPTLIVLRTITGFFGSVSIANGGGTISDMFEPGERAAIFGWYLLGPLLGPTLGPVLGAIVLDKLDWPWLFWIVFIICGIIVTGAIFFLQESYSPALLARKKKHLEQETGGSYYYEGEDDRGLLLKLSQAIQRPLKILFTQPIVLTMATYQALLFAISYSLFTQFQTIYGDGYGFSTLQVGLVFLGPGIGFLVAVRLVIPQIDTVYNYLTRKHNGQSKPEYRLPIANIGGVLIPISMFVFAWTIETHVHWAWSITATFFYGIGQVSVFNSVQNYYIDAFEKYAASAIAAGALFRSVVGGIVPLFTPLLIEKLGVGWGLSIFAFLAVALAPSPLLFYRYGKWLRERFAIDL